MLGRISQLISSPSKTTLTAARFVFNAVKSIVRSPVIAPGNHRLALRQESAIFRAMINRA
jgi:hypothetical protein